MAIRKPLLILFPLYFAQGLPYGFQSVALPVYLRQEGVSLAAIGLVSLLALPWALKALWAPLVDRYGASYKAWIAPLQILLALVTFAAAYLGSGPPLLFAVLLMNLFAATQDIAVDGLAVRMLTAKELGPANAIQVVGYKVGMLTGGGLLVWLSGSLGWRFLFFAMSALMALVFVITALFAEDARSDGGVSERKDLRVIIAQLRDAAKMGGAAIILIVMTAKIGEQIIGTMWKPFLIDKGFSVSQIGLWEGTYGMIASIGGSIAGAWVCRRLGLSRALLLTACLRVPGFVAQAWLARSAPSAAEVIAVTIGEHFFVGLMTTALFAYMMSKVEPRVAATHYTLLASLEVMGKSPGALVSGVLAQAIGYSWTFAIGAACSVIFVLIVMRAASEGASAAAARA